LIERREVDDQIGKEIDKQTKMIDNLQQQIDRLKAEEVKKIDLLRNELRLIQSDIREYGGSMVNQENFQKSMVEIFDLDDNSKLEEIIPDYRQKVDRLKGIIDSRKPMGEWLKDRAEFQKEFDKRQGEIGKFYDLIQEKINEEYEKRRQVAEENTRRMEEDMKRRRKEDAEYLKDLEEEFQEDRERRNKIKNHWSFITEIIPRNIISELKELYSRLLGFTFKVRVGKKEIKDKDKEE
jgi:hypothetical protein